MYSFKQKICIYFSVILLAISVGINIKDIFIDDDYTINYEYVNTKDMAQPRVAEKQVSEKNIFETILSSSDNLGAVEEVDMQLESVDLPVTQGAEAAETAPKQIWYLPTEVGRISQYPNYGHVAYDITSPRGTAEVIHPVANGVISGIYTDSAGALIVTVHHVINDVNYTSQYVHLSRYAEGIYTGKPVTINDALGYMGTTGYSTGVHLHLAVLDCALFDPADSKCSDLGAWYRYDKMRFSQGFYGLGYLMYVPGSWNSR